MQHIDRALTPADHEADAIALHRAQRAIAILPHGLLHCAGKESGAH